MPLLGMQQGIPVGGTEAPIAPPVETVTFALSPQGLGSATEQTAGAGVTIPVTITTTGLARVSWVVVGPGPSYTWLIDPVTVNTTGSVVVNPNFRVNQSFLKVFNPDNLEQAHDSGPLSLTLAVVEPPPPGEGGSAQAFAVWGKMSMGVNQERFTATAHADARKASYYQHYRDLGFRNVRFFIPGGFDDWQVKLWSSANDISGWLDAVDACVASGMPVSHIDGLDVIGSWHVYNESDGIKQSVKTDAVNAVDGYVRMFGAACRARNWPVDRVAIGTINEYGGGRNTDWYPERVRWNAILREELPNHTLVEGPCNWKDPRALFDPGFIPWGGMPAVGAYTPWDDENTIQDCHHYLEWDTPTANDGLGWIGNQVAAWCTANNRRMYMGEHGFDGALGTNSEDVNRWITRMDQQTQFNSVNKLKQCWWAVTDGAAWRMNEIGGNTMRGGLDGALLRWAGRIDASNGL